MPDTISALEQERQLEEQALAEAEAAPADDTPAPASETQPEAPAESAPAPADDKAPEAEGEEPAPGKTVPVSALVEERKARKAEEEARKKLEQEVQEARLFKARMEERQRIMQEQDARAKAEAEAKAKAEADAANVRPDEEIDPAGALQWDLQKAQRDAEAANRKAEEAQAAAQAAEAQRLISMREDFRRQTPDYDDALKFVVNTRKEALMADGLLTEQEAMAEIEMDARRLIAAAIQRGKNPASVLYGYAKGMGFKVKPAEAPKTEAPAPKTPSAEEKIEAAAEGSKIRSMGNAGGAAPSTMRLEDIDNMTSSQFRAWYANPENAAYYKKLCGQD